MKRVLCWGVLLSVMLVFTAGAQAYTLTWIDESKDYAVNDVVGGWKILDWKDAAARGGEWSAYGDVGGSTYGGNTVLWLFENGSSASVGLTVPSTAVAFMLESDGNDGSATFWVDNDIVLANYDMQTKETRTLIVSGLSYGNHTLKVVDVANNSGDDVHIYGGAAVAPVPVPAAAWLLGTGLVGLFGVRRKIRK
jgi:hypothetical protein